MGAVDANPNMNKNGSCDSASFGSHDDSNHSSLPPSNHERRPLISFDEEDDDEENERDYGALGSSFIDNNDSHHSTTTKKNKKKTTIMLDTSHHSLMSQSSNSSFRERFKEFRSMSRESITTSMRNLQSVIAQHTGSIGMLGSLSIAINNLTGPAMLSLPATFARAGIVPTTVTLIFVCILSALCSLHMANTISKVPLNAEFQQGVEFPEAFRTFWGSRWFVAANGLFFACITVLNVSSLVDNAQVLDTFLGHYNPWGGAWALALNGQQWTAAMVHWDPSICNDRILYEGGCVPFATSSLEKDDNRQTYLITVGYVVTAVLFLPLALMDLTENVQWQILGFFVLIVTSIQFIVTFAMSDLDASHLTWWGEHHEDLLGVVLFNFALVITVPAWLYEKEPHVDIPTVLHASTMISTLLYVLIGILGCLAMPGVSDNFLESIMSGSLGSAMQIGASIFAFFIIGLNIPLYSILTRLSLMGGGNEARANSRYGNRLCSRPVANVLAVYLPFGLSWTMYQGSYVTLLLSWGGMIFTSLVAFLLPLALALYVVETNYEDCKGSVPVYPWNLSEYLSSKQSQVLALKVLLLVSFVAVAAAIMGNVLAEENGIHSNATHATTTT
ncbi:expressed unknown protein [Seminavis robusta]|uniref:Amino acid transporter transmembrane domain-containing protein n=1 Tax=Seminavis robusta TaxID=568900 RepID=A0A9N8DKT3_9STRA|nr:expressed unknown protein [Seminavis robusta]|eukprot:Sro176_g077600.1 n/a (616) ;mRNA; r:96687-98534